MLKHYFLSSWLLLSLLPAANSATLCSSGSTNRTPVNVAFTEKQATTWHAKHHQHNRWLFKKIARFGHKLKINKDHYGFWGILFGLTSIGLIWWYSYWYGTLSLIFGIAFAIVALILGILGLKKGRKNKWAAVLSLLTTLPALVIMSLWIGLASFYLLNH